MNAHVVMPTTPPNAFPDIEYFRQGHYLANCSNLQPFPTDKSSPWQLAVVDRDDLTISIYFLAGETPCYGLRSTSIHETAQTVTLDIFLGDDPNTGQCNLDKQWYVTTTHLPNALAGRPLVSGAVAASGQPTPIVEHV
jgi:hypothetical protein